MMDDIKPFGHTAAAPIDEEMAAPEAPAAPAADAPEPAPAAAAPAPAAEAPSPAVERFRSCRWKAGPDAGGEFCTHRDVLPFAGKEGFKPESWCPDCAFYKLRRTPKKRERLDFTY
jgi:hypothetical protein